MDELAVAPGSTLAGRYRLEDLVGEDAGSMAWRAFDPVLNRSVGVQVLPAHDPRCAAFLEAGRRSTVVTDPRFLRVLDVAADEEGLTYVVREWARAVPLSVMLHEGPLRNRRAATLVGEVADALARAHDAGVQHRCLDLAAVLVKDTGAVRILGLATDHALRAASAGDAGAPTDAGSQYAAEQDDVDALGRLLYACLVARWPGSRAFELAAAPTEHGRLLRPRQVRAGVARDADSVCDRILGKPPRHHATPLVTARDIASALALVGEDELLVSDTSPSLGSFTAGTSVAASQAPAEPPPALLPSATPAAPPAGAAVGADGRRPRPPTEVRRARRLLWVGIALLVVLAALVAFYAGRQTAGPRAQITTTPGSGSQATQVAPEPLPFRQVSDFDPQGQNGENPQTVGQAYDHSLSTSWTTVTYFGNPQLGGLKQGVGLRVDLGRDRAVSAIDVRFAGKPTSYEVWAAPAGTSAAPADLSSMTRIARARATGEQSTVRLDAPVTTRFVVLWLTSLPEIAPGSYQGAVRELVLKGPPA
ncbi:MAG: protein kinase family protein [Nocardioidaceae bacterium]